MSTESTCELMFKSADEKWVTYTLRPGSPIYFGRNNDKMKDLIKSRYPHATYVFPTDEKESVLSGNQAHGVAHWLEADKRSGFYLRIFDKRNGDPPTNPLLVLDSTKKRWKTTTFNKDELFHLKTDEQFCIGGSFYIKVGNCVVPAALLNDVAPAPAPSAPRAPAALLNDVAPAPAPAPEKEDWGSAAGAGAALPNDVAAEKEKLNRCAHDRYCQYPFGASICTCC